MHETVVEILNIVGIDFQKLNDQSDQLIIYRDTLIDPEKYKTVKEKIGDLKKWSLKFIYYLYIFVFMPVM